MPTLRTEFEKEFKGKTLQGVIKKECAGDFEAALVSLASYTPPTGVAERIAAGEEVAPEVQPLPTSYQVVGAPPPPQQAYGYGAPPPQQAYGAPPAGYPADPNYRPHMQRQDSW